MFSQSDDEGCSSSRPIFILGITARSGTNYLAYLLRMHPHCAGTYPEFEDYFITQAHRLFEFAQVVKNHWSWGLGDLERDELLRCLGNGLLGFLKQHLKADRVVTKTPSVKGLPLFFQLFPDARLIVLVRDGRAVAESMLKTFNVPYEACIRKWAEAAESILDYDQMRKHSETRYMLVRYEDLLDDLRGQMSRILRFAGLPEGLYDFDAAARAPVIGSSSMRDEAGRIFWKPQSKPRGFDPLKRSAHWSNRQHARFNWIAKKQSEALGYPCQRSDGSPLLWWIYNVLFDAKETIGKIWRKFRTRKVRIERRRQLYPERKVPL